MPPTPMTTATSSACGPATTHAVDRDRHRLGETEHVTGQAVHLGSLAGDRRHRAVLGQSAVPLEAERPVARAEVEPARAAARAVAAPDACPGRDLVVHGQPVDAVAERDDPPGELVAGDHRAAMPRRRVSLDDREHPRPVRELGGIGAADAGDAHLQQDLARPGDRVVAILDPDVAAPVVDGRSHGRRLGTSKADAAGLGLRLTPQVFGHGRLVEVAEPGQDRPLEDVLVQLGLLERGIDLGRELERESQVLHREAQRERLRPLTGVLEHLAAVDDERPRQRARDEDLVGGGAVDPGALREHERLRHGLVEPVDSRR